MANVPNIGHSHPSWREPVWILSLKNGVIQNPKGLSMPPFALPGSLMKLVTATALLEEKLLTSNDRLECRGTSHVQGQTFRCQHPHGQLTIQEALGLSCNVFFAQASQPLSVLRFLQYAKRFQLDRPVNQERFIFSKEGDSTQSCQSYALGLNRNFQPSAWQLLRMAGLIARREIPELAPQTWQVLQHGMRMAVTRGTAFKLDASNQLHIAAKTGTTQHGHTFQSWLIGYFPFENPQYAFCVRTPAGTAKESAVPLAHQFLLSRKWI